MTKTRVIGIILLWAGSGLLAPVAAVALSDIELNSYLNQPLSARINLLSASADDVGSMDVRVSSTEAGAALSNATVLYQLGEDQDGHFILITTRDAVREPVMEITVDVSWARGRVVRNYSLIFDLR